MITIKNPFRLAMIIAGTSAYFLFGQGWMGVAFLTGAFVGSFTWDGDNYHG